MMKCEFEKVVDGLAQYINSELYSGMNDVQEFAARVLIGRAINNQEQIKHNLVNNGFIRTFGVIDGEGMVDIEGISNDIKREISRKDKITFNVPMFGKLTFRPSDVDIMYRTITGEELISNDTY